MLTFKQNLNPTISTVPVEVVIFCCSVTVPEYRKLDNESRRGVTASTILHTSRI